MREGAFYVFINFKQAAQFGHVGWGFRLGEDRYCFGSSDHLWRHDWWDLPAWIRYMHVPAGKDIDWWAEQGSKEQMLQMMGKGQLPEFKGKHIFYHAYKKVAIDEHACFPEEAMRAAEFTSANGWHLSENNCVHQAYFIFSKYGKEQVLPSPYKDPLNMIPKTF
ncbi:MAG: hypothetical protein K2X97_17335, partial [Mycobacteriaceae bacterium]|nr:hypothetical protein [Mycobacteriaceae bacterium]